MLVTQYWLFNQKWSTTSRISVKQGWWKVWHENFSCWL